MVQTYTTVWSKGGDSLTTTDREIESGGIFIPNPDEWATAEVKLDAVNEDLTRTGIQFLFRVKTGNGTGTVNWFDNIEIDAFDFQAPIS